MPPFSMSRSLILLAVIVFVLSAFGVSLGSVALIPIGLALYAAASLIP